MLRLQAGVLSYVLTIGILVSSGLSMLILYLYYSRLEYKNYEQRIRLLENLDTALEICKAEYEKYDYSESYFYDLYGKERDSVLITKKKWGMLDVFYAQSFQREVSYEKVFTLGHYPNKEGRSAIYLHNERGVLSIVGDTKLTGDCYLPKSGLQSAYINRVGYTNDELVYGQELESSLEFPESKIESVFKELSDLSGFDTQLMDSIYSFKNDSEIIENSEFLVSEQLAGNVILKTSGRAVFTSDADVNDLIVYASTIEFEDGFVGSGQFFASDTIIVHRDVKLDYPTVLAVYNPSEPAQIYIEESAEVSGWLLIDGDDEGFRRRVIYQEDASKINGMIYCNGMMETYGAVEGNVTTRKFLVNVPRGVYENYLLNAQIDATALHPEFLTLRQWFYSDSTEVMKYLY